MKSPYKKCLLCPRRCGVDREAGQRGYCGETADLRIAFAGIHRGEEPPITGNGGSGTIFVSGCNLGCAFCQNFQISQGIGNLGDAGPSPENLGPGAGNPFQKNHGSLGMGRIVETSEFSEICIKLQELGAENINIVTGSHAAPALALGIEASRKKGLFIPVLWNSSGYEGPETLEILSCFVNVYLPDLKTLDSGFSARFFNAPDYPERAAFAILRMMECQSLRFGPGRDSGTNDEACETLASGVMVRHLVIPGCLGMTRRVLAWFSVNCAGGPGRENSAGNQAKALLSLMTQYTPIAAQGNKTGIPERYICEDEYLAVISMLDEFGIDNGYCQELVTGSEWLPDFTRNNPFSSNLSRPLWHWR